MTLRSRVSSLVVVSLAAAGLFVPVVAAAPASAACTNPAGPNLFLYANRDGLGATLPARDSDSDLHDTALAGDFNDRASRVENTYNCNAWVLFDDTGWRDRNFCIKPGKRYDLHHSSMNFGDKTSSILKLSTTSCSGYTVPSSAAEV